MRRAREGNTDWGQRIALLMCIAFALIGLVPLSGGLLLRSAPAKAWAAGETTRLLSQHLGLTAHFQVELSLIPLRLEILNLAVKDTKAAKPAITADLIAISPRFFSLLAGRVDVGDIELENSSIRLEIQQGQLQNVAFLLPESDPSTPTLTRSPFRTLAITNAHLDLTIDGRRAELEGLDLDVVAEKDLSFDLALRAVGGQLSTTHQDPLRPAPSHLAYDEDKLCSLELRAQLSKAEILVRRFSLSAAMDQDDSAQVGAVCSASTEDRQLVLRLSQLRLHLDENNWPELRSNIMARAPLSLVNRFKPGLKGTGWTEFSGSVSYDGKSRLPEVHGTLSGAGMKLADFNVSDEFTASILISSDVVHVPTMTLVWANGTGRLTDFRFAPFEKNKPFQIAHLSTEGVDFQGVMRDVLVTNHSWVDWNFGKTEIDQVKGSISPFTLDGAFDGHTKAFVLWDRGFDDPTHRNMLAIPQAHLSGRFRANENELDFYHCDLDFGKSHIPVDLVSIGFYPQELIVRTQPQGGTIELEDLGPIADLKLAGQSSVFVDLKGPMTHPILKGTLSVDDLSIGGFEAGDVAESEIHFEPLFVEFANLKGHKGKMDYLLPKARLSFDGPAAVEFSSQVVSSHFSLEEFLGVFHFDQDPRFSELSAEGKVKAQIKYLLGGPEDRCGQGRLLVDGAAELNAAEFLGEQYSGGNGAFSLDWFDIEAGLRGLNLYLPSVSLRKGTGSVFGSIVVTEGGALSGDFVGTQIPLAQLDLLPEALSQLDGYLTGSAQLSGSLEALQLDAGLGISKLKWGGAQLGPSQLQLRLGRYPIPDDPKARRSGCGRTIPPPYVASTGEKEGELTVNGDLFGSTVQLTQLTLTQQADPILTGAVEFKRLDLAELAGLTQVSGSSRLLSSGQMSGKLVLDQFLVHAPFSSEGHLEVNQLDLVSAGITVQLEESPFFIRMLDHKLRSEKLALIARAPSGQTGIVDAAFQLASNQDVAASFRLRPTSLAVLAAVAPIVKRAEGKLSAEVTVDGKLSRPALHGKMAVLGGVIQVDGVAEPLEDLAVEAELDSLGLHIKSGTGKFGGGQLDFKGELPITNGALGQMELGILAHRVHYKSENHLNVTLDADLKLTALRSQEGQRSQENQHILPSLSGSVDILSASYNTPMSITADITTLTTRGEKTEISGYDVDKDNLELDLTIRSARPITVKNDLVQTSLRLDPSGLRISGTDQRFGAVGTVEVESGGRIFLRKNEFELKSGLVRFNDPTRLRPEVDVSAVTEYRRSNRGGANPNQTGSTDTSTSTVGSGNWRILMHAYGPPDNLKIDLTSDPPLGQDDIFLLLTVGLTRTELDQSRNAGVGSSVALEALGSLSGAESAVTDVVPVDEFRFGSTFSSRSGRTEPTVTIGKRLSDRIRASVTTSLSETSEVRSNVEYQATQNLSVEGAYDNSRNVASAAGGNVGGDVRWRVEFR